MTSSNTGQSIALSAKPVGTGGSSSSVSKKRGAKAKKIADAQLWVQQLRIKVDLQIVSEEEGQNQLSITVFSEPVPQVRMTRFSQHSNPDAIKYLGWKRKVSEAIKE